MPLNPQNVRPGQEQYEEYTVPAMLRDLKPHNRCRYYYRALDGELFSCTARTLKECRAKRDAWLAERAA